MTNPRGIHVGCSDNNEAYAEVYAYGSTLFYRIAENDDEVRSGVGPSMQMVELPCGTEPEFDFRSYIPFN